LLKPIDPSKIFNALDHIYTSVSQRKYHTAIFRGINDQLILDYDQIEYIEAFTKNHQGTIHMTNGCSYAIRITSLSELQNTTLSNDFVRCHRSFLINMNYITSYNSDYVKLHGHTEIPIGRKERIIFITSVIEHYKKDI